MSQVQILKPIFMKDKMENKCEQCVHLYSTAIALKGHVEIHKGEFHQCNQCEYSSHSLALLKAASLKHSDKESWKNVHSVNIQLHGNHQ